MTIKNTPADPRRVLRIGLLGSGFMGKCHTNAYRKIPYIYPSANLTTRLDVLCDKDEKKLEREALRYSFDRYTTDWHDVIADPQIDVVDNCLPDPMHVEPCIAALEAGKHVITEKPMAVSAVDAKRMRDAALRAAGRAVCTFNYRFMPAVRMAKDMIASGKLGTIYQARVNYLQMAGHDPSLAPEQVWYAAWPHSGGLQGIGSHALDQCRFLIGEIKSVSALVRTFNKGRAIPSAGDATAFSDEGAAGLLEFDNGAIAVLESSVVATGRKNFLSWEINASKGSLRWDLEHPNSLYVCTAGGADNSVFGFTEVSVTESFHPYAGAWWPSGHNIGWEHCHIIEKFHFLDAVANNKPISPFSATFEDGYRVAVLIDAMRRSSESGQRVNVSY